MDKLLLHACCAPCLSHPLEMLHKEYRITVFFSNSNIYPSEEYFRRLEYVKKLVNIYGVELVIDEYKHEDWYNFVKERRNEPEGGKRCILCFYYRLGRLYKYASASKFSFVTSTLTVSPYKNSKLIFNIARGLATKYPNIKYLEYNFKKQDGYLKSIKLSKKYNLYRQHYCGCEFSL